MSGSFTTCCGRHPPQSAGRPSRAFGDESRESTLAFQVFKKQRSSAATMEAGPAIDLTRANDVIVDLLGPPPVFDPAPCSSTHDRAGARHLGDSPDDAERVSAWADRLRAKRERDRAEILGEA